MVNITDFSVAVIYPNSAVTLALIACVAFIILGIFGNSLTIVALLNDRKLRHTLTTVFIVSLALTDLIFCSFNLPLTAVRYAYQKWVLGPTLCGLFPFFFYLNVAASLFNMVAITINRYVLIAHNTWYDRLYRPFTIALMIGFAWGFPLALLIPTLFGKWGKFGYDNETFSCTILQSEGRSSKKFLFLLGFVLPCAIITVCYGRIWLLVRRSSAHFRHTDKRQSDEANLTRTILAIFVSFLLCYLPLMIVNVFDDEETVPILHVLASILAWSASVINPICYAVLNRRYRQAFIACLPIYKLKCSSSGHRRNADFNRLYYTHVFRHVPIHNSCDTSGTHSGLYFNSSISNSVVV